MELKKYCYVLLIDGVDYAQLCGEINPISLTDAVKNSARMNNHYKDTDGIYVPMLFEDYLLAKENRKS